jgi:hypothetical protein
MIFLTPSLWQDLRSTYENGGSTNPRALAVPYACTDILCMQDSLQWFLHLSCAIWSWSCILHFHGIAVGVPYRAQVTAKQASRQSGEYALALVSLGAGKGVQGVGGILGG